MSGKPVIARTIAAFQKCKLVDSVVVVVSHKRIGEYQKIVKAFRLSKVKKIVAGASTRYGSVKAGLRELDQDTQIVAIHDGARPLISTQLIEKAIKACKKEKAVILAVPVTPTIKAVDKKTLRVLNTLDREQLWEVQTPQVFHRDVIVKAYNRKVRRAPTDDAGLVEHMGQKVKIILSDKRNIKITTREDLVCAQALLKYEH